MPEAKEAPEQAVLFVAMLASIASAANAEREDERASRAKAIAEEIDLIQILFHIGTLEANPGGSFWLAGIYE